LAGDGSDEGKSFYFKISAANSIGEGERSLPYLVVAATVPDPPQSLVRNDQLTSRSVISFSWSDGVTSGGSAIIDYKVSYDQSFGSWIEIGSGITTQSFTTTNA
jgi:hypothetical protein